MARAPKEAQVETPEGPQAEQPQDDLTPIEAEAQAAGAARVERIGNALRVDN